MLNCKRQQVQMFVRCKNLFDSAELQWKYDCYSSVKCAGFHDKNYPLHQIWKP